MIKNIMKKLGINTKEEKRERKLERLEQVFENISERNEEKRERKLERLEQVFENISERNEETIVVDYEEATNKIKEILEEQGDIIPLDIIQKVYNAEYEYLKEIGIAD